MPRSLPVRVGLVFLKVWVCILLVAAAGVPIVLYYAYQPPRVGEHVTSKECPISLPASASDVCYFVPPLFGHSTAYEFDVPEADFVKWAESRGIDVGPIGPSPVSVRRYLALMPHDPPGGADDPPVGVLRVDDGLANEWRFEDQSRAYVYDRRSGRAYFYSQSR